jgi:hypothetical protein
MIILPNNGFGFIVMLCLMALAAIVPFVVVLWLMLEFAPWWVAIPVAIAASMVFFSKLVKFEGGAR